MAKAKSGGTRSFLRGRVGSDVYSIGKDAKGNKQQIVRSLAESVANPQTLAQMRGRMIMSTIMQAVSSMSAIIDHSFDNVPAGQPNVSEFIRRNYALVKADVAAHPANGNAFGLNKYGEKGIKQGAYVVAAGSAIELAGATLNGASKTLTIVLSAGATIADLRSKLGIGVEDYFTAVCITADGKFLYNRFHVSQALASATEISASNINDVITLDGNVAVTLAFANNTITATFADFSANAGIIVSRKENATYKHNDVVLAAPSAPVYTSDDALPTYPTGTQRFLNGGGEEVSPFSPEPAPTPTPTGSITVTGFQVGSYSESGAETEIELPDYGTFNVKVSADGSSGTDTYKLMKNSAKNLSGATLMQSISAFPVTAANVSIPTEMYVLVVKNDNEIVGACRVYSLGQD
jgi:hypothetical protein